MLQIFQDFGLDFEIEEDLAGGVSYDKHGTPITDEVFYKALECEAVILGAVGGPKWDNVEFSKKPERALLKLRKELKLFANLRPAICFKQLVDASTLKPEVVSGLDIMIVRELTGGIYFGEPRGIKPIDNGERKGINTHTYTSSEIRRVAKIAFDLAKKRQNKVTSCEKSNVMEAGQLWRERYNKFRKKLKTKIKNNENCKSFWKSVPTALEAPGPVHMLARGSNRRTRKKKGGIPAGKTAYKFLKQKGYYYGL